MTADPSEKLKSQLDGGHAAIDQLTAEEAADLLTVFEGAREFERKGLNAAIDETLNALPRLFRGTARAIVFPKESKGGRS